MSTILTQEPVNPWAMMAANLGTQLLTGMLERSRQAEENRKLNALMNEVQNGVNAQRNQGAVQNFTAQNNIMPEGYDVNPWAKAFHQNYTPMTQYNIGTADINPLVQAQQAQNPATVQDYRAEAMKQLASKRFGMLNPAMVEQYLTPFYQGLTQQNQEAKKQAAIDAIRNATGNDGRLLEAQLGAAQGVIPDNVLGSMQNQRNFDATMGYNVNKDALAQRNWDLNFNAGRDDAMRNYQLAMARMAQDNAQFGRTYGLKERELLSNIEQQKWLRGQSEIANQSAAYANQLNSLEKAYTTLKEQRESYQNQMDGANDEKTKKFYAMKIHEIDQQIETIAKRYSDLSSLGYQGAAIQSSDVNPPFPQGNGANVKFDNAMQWVFDNEGGYVNDPDDSGGETNMGITKATFDSAKAKGLTKANSVADLTQADAKKIYKQEYWDKSKADELPDSIAEPYFDSVVHHGLAGGAKLLQKAINKFSGAPLVAETGKNIGQTIKTLKSLLTDAKSRMKFVDNLLDVRDERFDELAEKNPTQKKYLKGWKRRTQKFRDNNKPMWESPDGDIIPVGEYQKFVKLAGSDKQAQKDLTDTNYTRVKRELTPEQDMRPAYMKVNMATPYYNPFGFGIF